MKTSRQLLDSLFEAEDLRNSVQHFMRLGFDLEQAKEQVRRANAKHELKTVQRHRGHGDDNAHSVPVERPKALDLMMGLPPSDQYREGLGEANFHSPEEKAQLAKAKGKPPIRRLRRHF